MKVNIQKLYDKAKLPVKGDPYAAGWDLYAHSIEKTPGVVKVGTGVAIEVPKNFMGVLVPRSNISKHGWMLGNSIGIIDPTYSKEWLCMFRATGLNQTPFPYNIGDRIAQMFLLPSIDICFEEVEELEDHNRGEGFGSTGLQ